MEIFRRFCSTFLDLLILIILSVVALKIPWIKSTGLIQIALFSLLIFSIISALIKATPGKLIMGIHLKSHKSKLFFYQILIRELLKYLTISSCIGIIFIIINIMEGETFYERISGTYLDIHPIDFPTKTQIVFWKPTNNPRITYSIVRPVSAYLGMTATIIIVLLFLVFPQIRFKLVKDVRDDHSRQMIMDKYFGRLNPLITINLLQINLNNLSVYGESSGAYFIGLRKPGIDNADFSSISIQKTTNTIEQVWLKTYSSIINEFSSVSEIYNLNNKHPISIIYNGIFLESNKSKNPAKVVRSYSFLGKNIGISYQNSIQKGSQIIFNNNDEYYFSVLFIELNEAKSIVILYAPINKKTEFLWLLKQFQ